MNQFKMLHIYDDVDPGYYTFLLEHTEEAEGLPVLGSFELEIMNAAEVGIDAVGDATLIDIMKRDDIFFAVLKKEYGDALAVHHHTDIKDMEGWIIEDATPTAE